MENGLHNVVSDQKMSNTEEGANNERSATLNVMNLSYQPFKNPLRRYLELTRFKLTEYRLNKIFPAFKRILDREVIQGSMLHNINFVAKSGEVVSMLGDKGERREFVEILSGRKKHGYFDGDVCLRGKDIDASTYYHDKVTFVQEHPLYIPGLNYLEMLRFSAKLKMSGTRGSNSFNLLVEERIEELISLMSLSECKLHKIPDFPPERGSLGCDLRRLSIAVELVDMPYAVVIDEPTLNFDPAMSVGIMQCLKAVASKGVIVVCSQTRPHFQEMNHLDKVVMLSDGYSIYAGPPSKIQEHFCSKELGYEFKKGVDIVDFMIDISTGIERPIHQRTADLPFILQEKFEMSDLYESAGPGEVNASAFDPRFFYMWGYTAGLSDPKTTLYRGWIVLVRALFNKFKDYESLTRAVGSSLVVGVVIGYLQYGQGDYGHFVSSLLGTPYPNSANLVCAIFFIVGIAFLFPLSELHLAVQKLHLFRYEQAAGVCTLPAFFISYLISEMPFALAYNTISMTILYWMVSFRYGAENYKFFIFTTWMLSMLGVTTIYLLSSIFKTEIVVRDVMFMCLIWIIFLSGFPFQIPQLEENLQEASKLNPVRWGLEAFMKFKFESYVDGISFIEPYGFATFEIYDIYTILLNFLLICNSIFILSLIAAPIRLTRRTMTRHHSRDVSGDESALSSSDLVASLQDLPRVSTRRSESVKPALFMRESTVTGRDSKLSTNLSEIGEANNKRGPTVLIKELSYRVRDSKSESGYKTVLDRVSGQFDWGKLGMVLGATEAGKSTLMHVLAGDYSINTEVTGKVYFDAKPVDESTPLWTRCGFVPRHNAHVRDISVREALRFAMKLRCHNSLGLRVLEENVDNTIEILHLTDVAHKKVKTLNAGEKKRLSVGEEIVHGPKLLLMDEPTTDASLYEISVMLLCFREMVNLDRTVVASIYQPTADMFRLFDTLLLLSKGKVIYHGPVEFATRFFVESPFRFDESHYLNPADFLADISGEFISDSKGDFIPPEQLENYYSKTENFSTLQKRFRDDSPAVFSNPMLVHDPRPSVRDSHMSKRDSDMDQKEIMNSVEIEAHDPSGEKQLLRPKPKYPAPPAAVVACQQIYKYWFKLPTRSEIEKFFFVSQTLLWRATLALLCRYELVLGSIVMTTFLAAIFGWFMGPSDDQAGITNTLSFLAIGPMFLMIANIQFVFFMYNNHQVFLKEYARNLYGNFPQWLFSSIPFYLLRMSNGILFISIVYPMLEYSTEGDKFGFMLLCYMTFVLMTSVLTENVVFNAPNRTGIYVSIPAAAMGMFLFSGLFIKAQSLPEWMQPWIPSISPVRWSFQANFINLYEDSDLFLSLPGFSAYNNLLHLFGWGGKTKWYCLQMIVVIMVILKALGLITQGISSVASVGTKRTIAEE